MQNKSAAPEVYWIMGDGTGVGKTTLACALIRALNQAGTPSAGFKPYGAMLLENVARLVADLDPSPWRLYGEDAVALARASPLTSVEMGDIVGPSQFLCHSRWPSALLARTGSMALNNLEYFRSDQAIALEQGLDIQARLEQTGFPLAAAKPLGKLDFFGTASLSPEKQKPAFDYLLRLGAASIVCEGAGRFIPNWQDCPGVNHVISIAEGRAAFFPRADCQVTFSREGLLAPARELAAWLHRSSKPIYVAPLYYIAEHEQRDVAADSMVKEFLRLSGAAAALN